MSKKKNISIYVRHREITPSSYYRITQYLDNINCTKKYHQLISSNFYTKYLNRRKNSRFEDSRLNFQYYIILLFRTIYFLLTDLVVQPEIIIISRSLIPKYFPISLSFLLELVVSRSILIWDFDDNILENNEITHTEFSTYERHSKYIIITQNYLKRNINEKYWNKIILMPTTDGGFLDFNIQEIAKKRALSFSEQINLVWIGTSANLVNVENIIEILDSISKGIMSNSNKKVFLTIVCNKEFIPIQQLNWLKINNIVWTREKAIECVLDAHIGLMPLDENNYNLGKGGFKLIQYMAASLPVIASNVGYNKEIISPGIGFLISKPDEWEIAILSIIENIDVFKKYCDNSNYAFTSKFSFENNLKIWRELLAIGDET